MNYKNLNLTVDNTVIKANFNNIDIEIKKYLPVSDKYDLIMIALQKAKVGNKYNSLLLDVFFHLNLVYLYTNLEFSEEDREDELNIYDELWNSGFFEYFLSVLPETEYNFLFEALENILKEENAYNLSTAGLISSLIEDLPMKAQAAADIVNSFDKEKFAEVVNFATAANGNRPIE